MGVTETDTANSAATTAWQFTYDAAGNVVKSRMAPGELVQSPALLGVPIPPGSLAAGDLTIDWDADGQLERYDSYQITVAIGDQILITASSAGFDPVLILQRPTGGVATAFFDDSSGGGTSARMLVTADVAGTWVIAVTSRAPNTVGAYDLQIVSDKNAIVPTALVEYDFAYDKAGNLLIAAEDPTAVADFPGFGKAAAGIGVATYYTVNALNDVTAYRHLDTNNTDVVTKRVLYTYRADGTVGSVARYAAAGVSAPVGTSAATYDFTGRLTGITHTPAATGSQSVSYGYTYDAAGRIQTMTTPEGTSTFTLDAADQLSSASLTGETYTYDETGNRKNGGTQTGQGNRLTFDGTYRYAYDAEGNRTAKFRDTNTGGVLSAGDTDVTVYGYDQRNRLVAVSHVNAWTAAQATSLGAFTSQGTALPGSDLELRYTYDYADRRIRRSMDTDGAAGAGGESVSFAAYAGDARTLEIARTASFPGGFLGQVIQRNFYGNGADEILAVDKITWNGSTPTTSTFWTFTDHQDTVRDVVSGNATDRGQVVEHRQYDSFGKIGTQTIGSATTPGIDFGYAGRPLESRTGLSDNRARWYEPATGRFITEDPSGFKGGDANFFRYVGNDPLDKVDPSGFAAKWASAAKASVPAAGYGPGLPLMPVVSGVNALAMATEATSAPPLPGSLRSRLFAEVDKWPTRGDTGYSAIDASKALLASLIGNVVAKPAVYFGTYWRRDTMVENTHAIVARNSALNAGRSISVGYAMVQAFAGATTDNIAFSAVGYDPVQNRALDAQERIQRFVGGTAAFTAAFIPAARAAAAVPVGALNPVIGTRIVVRYVGPDEAAIAQRTGYIPTVDVFGAPKRVFITPEPPLSSITKAEGTYRIGVRDPVSPASSPTHVIIGRAAGAQFDYAGIVEGAQGVEMTTRSAISVIRVQRLYRP